MYLAQLIQGTQKTIEIINCLKILYRLIYCETLGLLIATRAQFNKK